MSTKTKTKRESAIEILLQTMQPANRETFQQFMHSYSDSYIYQTLENNGFVWSESHQKWVKQLPLFGGQS